MKNIIIKSLLIGSLLSVNTLAYEASSVKVKFVGYKSKAKTGVEGNFDKVKLEIQKNNDFMAFLTSSKVIIDSSSVNTKIKFRDKNINTTLFKPDSLKEIIAMIKKVNGDMKKGTLDVEIIMNKVSKTISMPYTNSNNTLMAQGTIDVLDFAMNNSYAAFAAKCKPFHAGKSWSDVAISFELPYTK